MVVLMVLRMVDWTVAAMVEEMVVESVYRKACQLAAYLVVMKDY